MEEFKLEPSEELAYWVGTVQTDGCLREKYDKKRSQSRVRIEFHICSVSTNDREG